MAHFLSTLVLAVMLREAQPKTDTGTIQQLTTKQHHRHSLASSKQKIPSCLPSKCCPVPKLLYYTVQAGTVTGVKSWLIFGSKDMIKMSSGKSHSIHFLPDPVLRLVTGCCKNGLTLGVHFLSDAGAVKRLLWPDGDVSIDPAEVK